MAKMSPPKIILYSISQGLTAYMETSLQKADTYSFAILFYELHGRHGPFGELTLMPSQILRKVVILDSKEPFRPPLVMLEECCEFVQNLLRDAWAENPMERPDFKVLFYI
jgi:guanylate cyclase